MAYRPLDGDSCFLVGIVEAFQAYSGQADKGFPVFAEKKTDGKLSLYGPLDVDGFGIARHMDRRFPAFESDSTCQRSSLEDRSAPAKRDDIIFADPGAPAIKEIGEQIAHIAEADDGYAEDDVVAADTEVLPPLDPVLQNPALSGRGTVFYAVWTEIVQIERCQGAAVDAETWPPIAADQGASGCLIHYFPLQSVKALGF